MADLDDFPFYSQLKRALRKVTTDIASHVAQADPHPGYTTAAELAATKLDDLATPDDNTDLNASTTRHGLLRKLDNTATNYLSGTGAWSVPAGAGGFTPDFGIWVSDAPPASAGAMDDEFDGAAGAGAPSGWTEVDHGAISTPSEQEYGLSLLQATHAGDSVAGVYKADPTGDITVWCKVSLSGLVANFVGAGIALFQDATSSSGDIVTHTLHFDSTATAVGTDTWTSYNTYGSGLSTKITAVDVSPTHAYLRVRRTGTTYEFDYSSDGRGWQRMHSGTIGFVPAHIGLVGNNVATGGDVRAVFDFFRSTNSDVGIAGVLGGDRVGMKRM